MTRYVKTYLFTKRSFAETGPIAGSSNVGYHLGMRYGQDHPFVRKEALSTCTFFSETSTPNRFSALDTQDENYSFHFSWVWLLNGVTANFHISEYEKICIRWPLSFLIVSHLVQSTSSKYVISAAMLTSRLEKLFEPKGEVVFLAWQKCQAKHFRPFIAAMNISHKFYCIVCRTYKSQTNLIWWVFHENLSLLCKLLLRKIARFQKFLLWNVFNIFCKTYALIN